MITNLEQIIGEIEDFINNWRLLETTGDYWRVPEGSKSSAGEKIISTGELLNVYQNINSTGGFSSILE